MSGTNPLPTDGPIADRIAAQLARVGKSGSVQKKTIAAGGSQTYKVTGAYAYIVRAPVRVNWRLDGQPFVPGHEGTSLTAAPGAFFEWIEVQNPSTAAIEVHIYGGFAEYHEERTPDAAPEPLTDTLARLLEGPQEVETEGTVDLDPFTDEDYPNIIRRKALVVSNNHATQELHLYASVNSGGVARGPMAIIWPRSTQIFHVAGRLQLFNPSETEAVPFLAGDIYYVTAPFPTS